jgi:hypothetical protein
MAVQKEFQCPPAEKRREGRPANITRPIIGCMEEDCDKCREYWGARGDNLVN